MSHLNVHFTGRKASFFGPDASGFQRNLLLDATHGRLCRTNAQGRLQPELLISWDYNPITATWTWKINPHLKFHHGRSVSSVDLEFSLLAPLLSKFEVPETSLARHILGSESIKKGQPFQSGSVPGIHLLNEHEIEIQIKDNGETFLSNMCKHPTTSIYARETLLNLGENLQSSSKHCGAHFVWKTIPIGAGAYKIDSIQNGEETIYLKNISKPEIVRLTTGLVIPEDTDVTSASFVNEIPKHLKPISLPSVNAIWGLFFDFNHDIVRDHRFREAVRMAFDPMEYSKLIPMGRPTSSILPYTMGFKNKMHVYTNISASRSLFRQLSLDYDLNSVRFFKPKNVDLIPIPAHIEYLATQLRKVGLQLDPLFSENGALMPLGFGPSVNDALSLFSLFAEGSGWVSKLAQPDTEFKELLHQMKLRKNDDSDVLMRLAHEQFARQVYAVPLCEQPLTYFINPKKIKSLGYFQDTILNIQAVEI